MCQVLLNGVKAAGEQMPQVVRKNLTGIHFGAGTELFHIMADVCPIQGLSTSGAKNVALVYTQLFCVFQQPDTQFLLQKNSAVFSFHANFRPSGLSRLHRNMLQLADPNACTANGQHDQIQPLISFGLSCRQKLFVFRFRQFPRLIQKRFPLYL